MYCNLFLEAFSWKKTREKIPSFWLASLKYKDIISLKETVKPTGGKSHLKSKQKTKQKKEKRKLQQRTFTNIYTVRINFEKCDLTVDFCLKNEPKECDMTYK